MNWCFQFLSFFFFICHAQWDLGMHENVLLRLTFFFPFLLASKRTAVQVSYKPALQSTRSPLKGSAKEFCLRHGNWLREKGPSWAQRLMEWLKNSNLVFIFYFLFVGYVCRTKTMHQLLYFKSKFPNYFVFTLGRYSFRLFLVQFRDECGG